MSKLSLQTPHIIHDVRIANLPIRRRVKRAIVASTLSMVENSGYEYAQGVIKNLVSDSKKFKSRALSEGELKERWPFSKEHFDYLVSVLKSQPAVFFNFFKFFDLIIIDDGVTEDDFLKDSCERLASTENTEISREVRELGELLCCASVEEAVEKVISDEESTFHKTAVSKPHTFRSNLRNIFHTYKDCLAQVLEEAPLREIRLVPIDTGSYLPADISAQAEVHQLTHKQADDIANFGEFLIHENLNTNPFVSCVFSQEWVSYAMEQAWDRKVSDRLPTIGSICSVPKGANDFRLIANPNKWVNQMFAPLSSILYQWCRKSGHDYTYNQEAGMNSAIGWYRDGLHVYGDDLSQASDNLPKDIFTALVSHNVKLVELVDNLFRIVDTYGFTGPGGSRVVFKRGQPLGTWPSFPILSLSHGFTVATAILASGGVMKYSVLGDDILYVEDGSQRCYRALMEFMKVPVNLKKSFDGDYFEFAGRRFDSSSRSAYFTPDLFPNPGLQDIIEWCRATGVLVPFYGLDSELRKQFTGVLSTVQKTFDGESRYSVQAPRIWRNLLCCKNPHVRSQRDIDYYVYTEVYAPHKDVSDTDFVSGCYVVPNLAGTCDIVSPYSMAIKVIKRGITLTDGRTLLLSDVMNLKRLAVRRRPDYKGLRHSSETSLMAMMRTSLFIEKTLRISAKGTSPSDSLTEERLNSPEQESPSGAEACAFAEAVRALFKSWIQLLFRLISGG